MVTDNAVQRLPEVFVLLREYHGHGKKKLEAQLQMSSGGMHRVESGVCRLTLDFMRVAARFYGIEMSSIMVFAECLERKSIEGIEEPKVKAIWEWDRNRKLLAKERAERKLAEEQRKKAERDEMDFGALVEVPVEPRRKRRLKAEIELKVESTHEQQWLSVLGREKYIEYFNKRK